MRLKYRSYYFTVKKQVNQLETTGFVMSAGYYVQLSPIHFVFSKIDNVQTSSFNI